MKSWFALVGLLALAQLAGAQSLGDAARKERERREGLGKAGAAARTLTDADLASARGTLATGASESEEESAPDAEEPPQEGRPASKAPSREGPEAMAPARGEEYWRGRVNEAQARIEAARQRYDILQRMIVIGQPAQYNENGQRVIYSIYQMKEKADAAETELRAAEKALEDLFEEARHAGALPGWLR
jgi:hypothetical protein